MNRVELAEQFKSDFATLSESQKVARVLNWFDSFSKDLFARLDVIWINLYILEERCKTNNTSKESRLACEEKINATNEFLKYNLTFCQNEMFTEIQKCKHFKNREEFSEDKITHCIVDKVLFAGLSLLEAEHKINHFAKVIETEYNENNLEKPLRSVLQPYLVKDRDLDEISISKYL